MDLGYILYILAAPFLSALGIVISIGIVSTIISERKKPLRRYLAKDLIRVLFVSEFCCRSCGRSFVVYEGRERIPYCQECGAPDPKHVLTQELREELRFKVSKKY